LCYSLGKFSALIQPLFAALLCTLFNFNVAFTVGFTASAAVTLRGLGVLGVDIGSSLLGVLLADLIGDVGVLGLCTLSSVASLIFTSFSIIHCFLGGAFIGNVFSVFISLVLYDLIICG
jgi:hypothetical protein